MADDGAERTVEDGAERAAEDGAERLAGGRLAAWLAFGAGALAGLPVLRTWWHQDDWGLLARAARLIDADAVPVRWLSRVLYWDLSWPLFHLDPLPYAATRLLLHGGSAALLAAIAGRAGLPPLAQLAAALLFAASPLAFTPLFWASGVQELLAAFLALAAVERYLAWSRRTEGAAPAAVAVAAAPSAEPGGAPSAAPDAPAGRARPALPAAFQMPAVVALGAAAMLAKESAAGLPLLLGGLTWARWGKPARWPRAAAVALAALAAAAVAAAVLALKGFDTSAGAPFALGGVKAGALNLLTYAVWLVMPGPFLRTHLYAPHLLFGLLIWAGWAAWGAAAWRRGDRRPLAALAGCLLALAPVLPLDGHAAPYMAYLAAAGTSLAAALLLPRRWRAGGAVLIALAALGTAVGWARHDTVCRARNADGRPRDQQVARAELSRSAVDALASFRARATPPGEAPVTDIVLLQLPATQQIADMADRLDASMVLPSDLYTSLQGVLGPTVMLGQGVTLRWLNRLDKAPPAAAVFLDAGDRWRFWGRVDQARLYAALTAVGRGQYLRATRALLQAALGGGQKLPFLYDADQLPVTPAQVRANAAAFEAFLASPATELPAEAVAALRAIFRELLRIVEEPAAAPAAG